jgi:microcystin-dependent protein
METTPIYALPFPDETDTADVPRDVKALAQRLEAVLPNVGFPTGAGCEWYAATAPTGFLICDGSAISRTTFAALFGVLGTIWGAGDGTTTFNLPDTRGRVILGYAASGGHADASTLNANDGTSLPNRRGRHGHTNGLTLPAHGHAVSDPTHAHGVNDPGHLHHRGTQTNPTVLYLWQAADYVGTGGEGTLDSGYPTVMPATTGIAINGAATGIGVGNPTSYPPIAGTIGLAAGVLNDSPSYVVANRIVKT